MGLLETIPLEVLTALGAALVGIAFGLAYGRIDGRMKGWDEGFDDGYESANKWPPGESSVVSEDEAEAFAEAAREHSEGERVWVDRREFEDAPGHPMWRVSIMDGEDTDGGTIHKTESDDE